MSWIQELYQTYEACSGGSQFSKVPLPPVGHIEQQVHIEVILDGDGDFVRAKVLNKEPTVIPVTESSAGRTSTAIPCTACKY